jgi:hypothetical protein
MWVQAGPSGEHRSFDVIAKAKGVSKGTIVRWAQKDRWKQRAAEIAAQVADKNDSSLVKHKIRLADKLQLLMDHIEQQIPKREIGSAEGGAHAFASLLRLQTQLLDPGKVPADRIEIARHLVPRVLLSLIEKYSDDPDMQKKFELRRAEITKIVTEDLVKFANDDYKKE